jgi:excisionase family DNA binding protein
MIKRRIEIIAFERERIIKKPAQMLCPICHLSSEFLTVRQASALTQVTRKSIYRWLASGKAHGVKTAGGGQRICRHSLFRKSHSDVPTEQIFLHLAEEKNNPTPNMNLIS